LIGQTIRHRRLRTTDVTPLVLILWNSVLYRSQSSRSVSSDKGYGCWKQLKGDAKGQFLVSKKDVNVLKY